MPHFIKLTSSCNIDWFFIPNDRSAYVLGNNSILIFLNYKLILDVKECSIEVAHKYENFMIIEEFGQDDENNNEFYVHNIPTLLLSFRWSTEVLFEFMMIIVANFIIKFQVCVCFNMIFYVRLWMIEQAVHSICSIWKVVKSIERMRAVEFSATVILTRKMVIS